MAGDRLARKLRYCRALGRARLGIALRPLDRYRQADDELASKTDASAGGAYRAAVHLHQTPYQRQPYSKPALRATSVIELREELEDSGQHLCCYTDTRISDRDLHVPIAPSCTERDAPARFGVLGSIAEHIPQRL